MKSFTGFEKAQLMSREMDRLRQEIVVGAHAFQRLVVVFLTAFVGIIGLYSGEGLVSEVHKAALILLLSQVEVVLCLFSASFVSYQNVRIGYARALERKINDLANDNIIIWHSRISPRYMASPSCAFFFACLLQSIAYILIFGVLSYFTFALTNSFIWGVFFTIEAVLCLGAHIRATCEIKPVECFALEKQQERKEPSDSTS